MKKIINIVILVIALVIAAVVLVMRFMPGKVITSILPKSNPLGNVACSYPVRVSGNSMAPVFLDGNTVIFDKCIHDKENLAIGTIVLFRDFGKVRIGRIREQLAGSSGKYYKISPEARSGDVADVLPDNIIAVYEK